MNTSLYEKQLDEKFLQTLYHRNRLWNGCFRVDQMNNGALNTPSSIIEIL